MGRRLDAGKCTPDHTSSWVVAREGGLAGDKADDTPLGRRKASGSATTSAVTCLEQGQAAAQSRRRRMKPSPRSEAGGHRLLRVQADTARYRLKPWKGGVSCPGRGPRLQQGSDSSSVSRIESRSGGVRSGRKPHRTIRV